MSNSFGHGTDCGHNLEDKKENQEKHQDPEKNAVIVLKTIIAAEAVMYVSTNARLLYSWVNH